MTLTSPQEQFRWLLGSAWRVPAIALAILLVYAGTFLPNWATVLTVATTVVMTALATTMVAALVGFLFGIPRALQDDSPPPDRTAAAQAALGSSVESAPTRSSYGVNTNLEQISDWLTKIIVGVGLIEFAKLADTAHRLIEGLAPGFGGQPTSSLVAGATLTFFAASGFIFGYLLTRTYLTSAFRAFDVSEISSMATSAAVAATRKGAARRDEQDAEALKLVARQLAGEVDAVPVEELTDVLRSASVVIRQQILDQARASRNATWEWRTIQDPIQQSKAAATHTRTIPIFTALAVVNPDDAQIHAELGYALKDDQHPNLDRAYTQLTQSIELARTAGLSTAWQKMNRAIISIRQGRESDAILSDLRDARGGHSNRVRRIIETHSEIQNWLRDKRLTIPGQ